jgi:hypothetical protein
MSFVPIGHTPDSGNKKERAPVEPTLKSRSDRDPIVMRYPKAGQPKYSDFRRRRKGAIGRVSLTERPDQQAR